MLQLEFIIEKRGPDIWTVLLNFYPSHSQYQFSVSRKLSAVEVKNREICDICGFDSLNCEKMCNKKDALASNFDRKWRPDIMPLPTTLNDFSVSRSLPEGENAPM